MTPQQRRLARQNYLATGRASLGKRQRAWQRYQQLPAAQRHALARQAHQPPQAPGRVGQFVLHRPPAPAHPAASAARRPLAPPSALAPVPRGAASAARAAAIKPGRVASRPLGTASAAAAPSPRPAASAAPTAAPASGATR
jgi:hypothetical protein